MIQRLNLRMMARLSQSQQGLEDRMQTGDQAGERISTLGVQIGPDFWLVEMGEVSEVLPIPPITKVPFTRPWYCGVTNVHGNLYSVVDLAAFMGQAEVQHDRSSRILLVAQKFAFNAGLLVDHVLGLRNTHAWRRNEVDGMVQYEDGQGQVWWLMDVARLLKQPEFLHVEN
ncbi:MAG: chemotaxis protein CheW [Gallionellaceae bacterium]|nr:chemotaxis protein CheW [Gallionellaceae bacterium]